MNKYQIRLSKLPEDRIALVRALRLIGNLGLKQANDLALHVGRFPQSVLVAGVDESTAGHIATAFKDLGAEVTVEPSSLDTPMLCTPMVNAKFSWRGWGPFRLIRKAA